jgi:hypothetical protein
MSSNAAATGTWKQLDAELARWLRVRTTLRASRQRTESPLDGTAMALRRVRATLGFIGAGVNTDDTSTIALVTRAYRWAIRVARELQAIEHQELDAMNEWTALEKFAPFALAFFDSVLAAPFAAADDSSEVARLRTEIDAVLAPMSIAMASSAMAA